MSRPEDEGRTTVVVCSADGPTLRGDLRAPARPWLRAAARDRCRGGIPPVPVRTRRGADPRPRSAGRLRSRPAAGAESRTRTSPTSRCSRSHREARCRGRPGTTPPSPSTTSCRDRSTSTTWSAGWRRSSGAATAATTPCSGWASCHRPAAPQGHRRRPRGAAGEEGVHPAPRPRLRPDPRLRQGGTAPRRLGPGRTGGERPHPRQPREPAAAQTRPRGTTLRRQLLGHRLPARRLRRGRRSRSPTAEVKTDEPPRARHPGPSRRDDRGAARDRPSERLRRAGRQGRGPPPPPQAPRPEGGDQGGGGAGAPRLLARARPDPRPRQGRPRGGARIWRRGSTR